MDGLQNGLPKEPSRNVGSCMTWWNLLYYGGHSCNTEEFGPSWWRFSIHPTWNIKQYERHVWINHLKLPYKHLLALVSRKRREYYLSFWTHASAPFVAHMTSSYQNPFDHVRDSTQLKKKEHGWPRSISPFLRGRKHLFFLVLSTTLGTKISLDVPKSRELWIYKL